MNMNTDKKFFSKMGISYLSLSIIIIVLVIIANLILSATHQPYDINIETIINAICTYLLSLPFIIWIMNKFDKSKLKKKNLTLKEFLIALSICFALMYIGNIIGLIITDTLGGLINTPISNPMSELISSSNIWINIIIITTIAPIFEEFIFRKLIIDRTIKYGKVVSVFLSALLFGLFHGNINQFFYAFLVGLVFAHVYVKTGKLIYSIILHFIMNLCGSVLSLYASDIVNNLIAGTTVPLIPSILGITYFIIIMALSLIGLVYLVLNYDKIIFKDNTLEKPLQTILINPGMICFIVYSIITFILAF